MDCATEQSSDMSPMGRVRCNTWHAGIEDKCDPSSSESPGSVSSSHNFRRPNLRRNAWGPTSYADLIAAAIDSSPERRLTLAQIYDWMVTNVSYFSEKAENPNSAGWKNSIRHNLSLHRRFVRTPHADGKSSWWTLNPTEPSSSRWSRAPVSRRRADSVDVRSLSSQQRPRRGRKLCGVENVLGDRERRASGKGSLLANCTETLIYNPIEEASNSNDQGIGGFSNANELFTAAASPLSFTNLISPTGFESNAFSFNLTSHIVFGDTEISPHPTSSEKLLTFGGQRSSLADCALYSEESVACHDEDSATGMVTQLSLGPTSWNGLTNGSFVNALDDGNYATNEGDKLSDLFSDIAMSYDDAVLHLDSQSRDGLELDHQSQSYVAQDLGCCNERLLFAHQSSSMQEAEFSLRRGSDAPPPSPEYNCDVPPTRDDDQLVTNRLWSSVLSSKFSELSNSSDMDTDH